MAAPIYYRWDDGNAPVARGERRSLHDILYACLVTGYGTKPAAGWTREYVNATFDKAVFRNNTTTGLGFYVQVDGNSPLSAYLPVIKSYEAMTSVDDGLFPFYATAQTIATSTTASTTARPWVLIADDRAFYFFCWPGITTTPSNSDTNTTSGFFFGDVNKFLTDDAYACGLSVGSSSAFSIGYLQNPSTTTVTNYQGICFSRGSSGVYAPFVAALVRGGGPGAEARAGDDGVAYTPGDQILISRPHINGGTAYSLRGWVPGFYYPCHDLAFDQLANVSSDGKTFLSLRLKIVNGPSNIFISLDDWRV